jgi:hypothetical protein
MNNSHSTDRSAFHVVLYVALHTAICFLLALALGWIETGIRIAAADRNASTEFYGMFFVIWLVFIGPVSSALSVPVHALIFFHAKSRAHMHSLSASAVICGVIWGLLQATTFMNS